MIQKENREFKDSLCATCEWKKGEYLGNRGDLKVKCHIFVQCKPVFAGEFYKKCSAYLKKEENQNTMAILDDAGGTTIIKTPPNLLTLMEGLYDKAEKRVQRAKQKEIRKKRV